ncbi:sensor histidine kinase [Nocardioides campestrisoli]|uniref:sensor histidine kinase n=1 Tax=Nocardioides campestrisoli TaxID=2736757 RepID=UPI0015E79A88|nr:ATP-binding protein [Nocardioides campestrisoli]
MGDVGPSVLWSSLVELGSDLDETEVLRRTVEAACAATGAGRCRLEVLAADGRVLRVLTERGRWSTRPPRSAAPAERIVEQVVVDGVPVARVVGWNKLGDAAFDDDDAGRLALVALMAGTALRHTRVRVESERRRLGLQAAREVARALSSSDSGEDVLSVLSGSLRRALAATGVGLLVPHATGVHDIQAIDVGRGYLPRSRTLFALAGPRIKEILRTGEEQVLTFDDDLIAVLPVEPKAGGRHLLGAWWTGRTEPVSSEELALVRMFADQASIAMDQARARHDREQLLLVSERERIARDLHDVVIQRIFATGLQIRGLRRHEDVARIRAGIERGVGDLDLVIRDIRTTIFHLEHGTRPRLRRDARSLVREYVPVLGFTPVVLAQGDLDTEVDPVVAEHLLASLRELLSNVVRHAEARFCRVEVGLHDGWVVLEVQDDGRGIDPEAPRSGLENVGLRAALLGGTMSLETAPSTGTLVRLRVPVSAPPGPQLRASAGRNRPPRAPGAVGEQDATPSSGSGR